MERSSPTAGDFGHRASKVLGVVEQHFLENVVGGMFVEVIIFYRVECQM